jgi:hypothetical protein
MNREEGIQNAIQDLLLRGQAGHNLVHLGNNGAKEGGSTEEQKYAEDLQTGS